MPKQPVPAVASYIALLPASLQVFGAERGPAYAPLSKWRRNAQQPSCPDLVMLLRKETVEQPKLVASLGLQPGYQALITSAAA